MALAGVAAAETLTYDVERTENAVTFDLGEAATPEELTWTALTITTPANGALGTGNSVIDWSEDTGNLTNSWELSFTLDPSRLSNEYLFGTVKGSSGADGYTLQITSNGKIQLNENKSSKMLAVGSYTAADSAVAITLQFVKFVDNKGEFISGLFTLTVGNVSASCTIDEVANTIFTKSEICRFCCYPRAHHGYAFSAGFGRSGCTPPPQVISANNKFEWGNQALHRATALGFTTLGGSFM